MINGSAGRKVFKFVENNDFTCKTTDEVTTLNINAFMLMTASSISHSLSTRGKLWHRQTLSMYKNKWNMRRGEGGCMPAACSSRPAGVQQHILRRMFYPGQETVSTIITLIIYTHKLLFVCTRRRRRRRRRTGTWNFSFSYPPFAW